MATGNLEYVQYYSIMEGKVCRQFKEPTAHSKTRVNKSGKTVHEEFYDYISGLITNIETKDSDFGRLWVITLMDDNQKQVLQLNYSSGYSQAFLKTLPNLDLQKKTTFIPKQEIKEGGKKKTTMFLTQDGKAIKWFYTNENKNGLPDLDVREGKGKDRGRKIYYDSEVMDFLEEMVKEDIIPHLPSSEIINEDPVDEEEVDEIEDDETENSKTKEKPKTKQSNTKKESSKSAKSKSSGKAPVKPGSKSSGQDKGNYKKKLPF